MLSESKTILPKISAPLSPALFAGIVLGAAAIGVGAIVYFFNPGTHSFYPKCAFHSLTGLNCPGCGMTRSLYALLHGNVLLAVRDNALFVLALAALALWSAQFAVRKMWNLPAKFNVPPKFLWGFLIIAFAFALVRNLPGFEWLSP